MLKLNKDSAVGTFVIIIAFCLVCSVLVSSAVVALGPFQQAAIANDRQVNILKVSGYDVETTVADTNTEWSKLQATAWMKKGDMVNDIKPIWAYADSLYNGTCNQCHGAPEIAHFDANGWIGTLNGMIGFTSLDKREERTLLKYLQMNASDTAGKAHGDKKEEK